MTTSSKAKSSLLANNNWFARNVASSRHESRDDHGQEEENDLDNQQSSSQSNQVAISKLSARNKPATALSSINQENSQRVPRASNVVIVSEEDGRGEVTDEQCKVCNGAEKLESALETTDGDDREGGKDNSGDRETKGDINSVDASVAGLFDLMMEPGEDSSENDGKGELEETKPPDAEL